MRIINPKADLNKMKKNEFEEFVMELFNDKMKQKSRLFAHF